MSVAVMVQTAENADQSGGIGLSDAYRAALRLIEAQTDNPHLREMVRAEGRAATPDTADAFDADLARPLRRSLTAWLKTLRPKRTEAERAAKRQAVERARAQCREEILCADHFGSAEQSHSAPSASDAPATIKPHPEDARIHIWLKQHEGRAAEDDAIIRVIRLRLWGGSLPPNQPPMSSPSSPMLGKKSLSAAHGLSGVLNKDGGLRKSLLRYIGGKYKFLDTILAHLPEGIDEYREPFLGGGTVALRFSVRHPDVPVWVNDANRVISTFWTIVRDSPDRLVEELFRINGQASDVQKARALFLTLKRDLPSGRLSAMETAAAFFYLNRASYGGTTQHGGFSPSAYSTRWGQKFIERILVFSGVVRNWRITNSDYSELLTAPMIGCMPLVYLDPPYEINQNLYHGHRGFDHDRFAAHARDTGARVLISYNDSSTISARFAGWHKQKLRVRYSARGVDAERQQSTELLLRNYPLDKDVM